MATTERVPLNAHRLVRPKEGRPYCSAPYCVWHPSSGAVVEDFRRHLYELAPKRKDVS